MNKATQKTEQGGSGWFRRRVLRVKVLLPLAFVLAALLLFVIVRQMSGLLAWQQEAERWQGDGEMEFSQISCYLPVDGKVGVNQIYTFRSSAMQKLEEASVDVRGGQVMMLDAWSTVGKANAATALGKGEASVIAVGGNFFDFHPLRLLSGDYIRESDLMHDRVLLDEELAWLLFGGTDLQGMQLQLNGVTFVVAGVIEREQDFASKLAYTAGMGLYMSYDAWLTLNSDAAIDCYEFVLAEPVKGFALGVAREKFPIGTGEILCPTTRYSYGNLMDVMLQYGKRAMQTQGIVYPYWENAARCIDSWAGLCAFLATLLLIYPLIMLVIMVIRLFRTTKEKLEDDWIPAARDTAEEAIRVRQRRRWEKKHGIHEK